MSGHSKWSTIKRHKALVDAKRGKIFSIIGKEITLAVKSGGKNPDFNPQLRTLLSKAKSANMPNDNIQKAIQKGTGELPGMQIEELLYEGYGPGGVGFIVEVTTDNKNRAVSEVRSAFSKCGGNLANSGALAFTFQRKGQFLISKEKIDEDKLLEVALEAGAEDVVTEDDHFEVLSSVADFYTISKAFEEAQIEPDSSELVYLPVTTIPVNDAELATKLLKLVERLEESDDVKDVYTNYEFDPSLNLEG